VPSWCFLLIDQPADVPWLYALLTAQVVAGAVFNPAKSAALPNITTPAELLTANALLSATWSTMLAVGAALGGFAVEALGTEAVFWIDSGTYLVSAVFIFSTTIPQETEPVDRALVRSAVREIVDGWQHLRAHPRIGRFAFAKATWALGGGALVYMLALIGDRVARSDRGRAGVWGPPGGVWARLARPRGSPGASRRRGRAEGPGGRSCSRKRGLTRTNLGADEKISPRRFLEQGHVKASCRDGTCLAILFNVSAKRRWTPTALPRSRTTRKDKPRETSRSKPPPLTASDAV